MLATLTAAWQSITKVLPWLWSRLHAAFVTPRFARILSNFLAEVAVLVFVFPGLEIIIRNEPNRLNTVIFWSWAITAICLVAAAIISMIGDLS
ncbi:MAG: hypothetical protein DMG88_08410 [Acidobacteria bacterium]|nr:MAG: hypothetical protein DMG88_08410 [Acidobacteriota bacterium]